MSLQDFVGGECGQNPVLKVASHFTAQPLGHDVGVGHSSSHYQLPQNCANLPPTSFRMDVLLKEMQGFDAKHDVMHPSGGLEATTHPDWSQEFLLTNNPIQVDPAFASSGRWVGEFMTKNHHAVDNGFRLRNGEGGLPPAMMDAVYNQAYLPQHSGAMSAKELLDDRNWTNELEEISDQRLDKTELMRTSEDILKTVSDPKMKATEFMSFVEKLSTGEIYPDGQQAEAASQEWVSEYERSLDREATSGPQSDWADEFSRQRNPDEESRESYWQRLNDEWEKLAKEESATHPWLTTSTNLLKEPYQFTEENTFKESADPFEEGKRKLQEGDIPSAVLLFESAVQKQPGHVPSWLYLGTTQALNEQDLLSISALNKCLELEPSNLDALMSLATSLTNESFHLQACNALKGWLKSNPKYSDLVTETITDKLPTSTLLPPSELSKVQNLFMQAARRTSANEVDPDVQCGLGVLFNIGMDFEKASDCFQAALGAKPDNPLMWNRLGATLANGGRSSEAIGAYRRALELSPGYIRTRYNLGIACINLQAYRESAEHFLTALNMQASGKHSKLTTKEKNSTMSDSIWSSLRTSLHLSSLSHLTHLIDARNLEELNRQLS